MNWRSFSTLQIALGISVAVHAALLGLRIVNPEGFNRVFEDTPLEVILVNTKTNEKADKAQAIAQTRLAGGGDAAAGRATSPLPPSALSCTRWLTAWPRSVSPGSSRVSSTTSATLFIVVRRSMAAR